METSPTVGALLRGYRLAAALSQEELAERAGLSLRGISDLERGVRRHPYPATIRRLSAALGLEPHERAALLAASQQRAARPPLVLIRGDEHALPPRSSTIPDEPNRFVGRQREVAEIAALLQEPEMRLLTLTGAGGIGKTRLAVRVCRILADQMPGDLVFVSLAPLSQATLVLPAICRAVGLEEDARWGHEHILHEHLESSDSLLILDNFEHVMDAAPAVASLLDACRSLRILVTSREPLHLRREHQYAVAPLSLPAADTGIAADDLKSYDAVALFTERASAASARSIDSGDAIGLVTDICRRVDGLPLGIELAAAQLKYFAPSTLDAMLSDSQQFLVKGSRDLPARQRTLRDTIEWSYSLLDNCERRLFAELSIFSGGCTLEAAEAVCGWEGTAAVLAALVDKSLLQRADGDTPRLVMLETIRAHAADKLTASGSRATLAERHTAYFSALAEQAELGLQGPQQMEWVRRLEADLDNLRAVLTRSLDGHLDVGLLLFHRTRRFWQGHPVEAVAWLERALARRHQATPTIMAPVLLDLMLFLEWSDEIEVYFREAMNIFADANDQAGVADALCLLAVRQVYVDHHEQAWALAKQASEILKKAEEGPAHERLEATLAGLTQWGGDLTESRRRYEHLLARARARGDWDECLRFTHVLAEGAAMLWDGEGAIRWGHEALALSRTVARAGAVSGALRTISYGLFILGQLREADEYARESLRANLGHGPASPLVLEQLALCAGAREEWERAACLWGIVDARRETIGLQAPELARTIYQRYRDAVYEHLGKGAWVLAYARGRALSLADAVTYALG